MYALLVPASKLDTVFWIVLETAFSFCDENASFDLLMNFSVETNKPFTVDEEKNGKAK